VITVTDTGIGIPEEERPFLFDRFYRVDKSRSREGGGTGLGLAIVQQLMHAHDGDIHVSSTPGEGTCFMLIFPSLGKDV
jgi:signal transduction histidine kinase